MIIRYKEPLYGSSDKFPSSHGEKEIPEYKLEHMKNGGVCLKKTGMKPIYEMIQANKVNCDLSSVIETCVHHNQLAVCDVDDVTNAIADFSGLSSMADWYAGMKNLENVWQQMPLEVREKFNSSPTAFVGSIGQLDFKEKIQSGYEAYSKAFAKRLEVVQEPVSAETTVTQTVNEKSEVSE